MKKMLLLSILFLLIVSNNCQVVKTLNPDIGKIKVLAYSHNGDYLVCATNGGVFSSNKVSVYSVSEWKKTKEFDSRGLTITSIKFSPNDNFIVASSILHSLENTAVLVYDINGNLIFNPEIINDAWGVEFTKDSKFIILNCAISQSKYLYEKYVWNGSTTMVYYDIENGKQSKYLIKEYSYEEKHKPDKNDKNSEAISYHPLILTNDGKYMLSVSFNSQLILWDIINRKHDVLETKNDLLRALVDISPDGKIAAVGNYSKDYWIYLWDLNSKLQIKSFKGHKDWVTSVAFSPDGNYLASASEDETIRLWDVKTGTTVKVLKGHDDNINTVAFSPDGKYLVSGGDDGRVFIWDANELLPELKLFTANYDLNFGISKELEEEKQKEIDALNEYFKPKGEFETTEEYNARIAKASEDKKAIEEKFQQKFQEYVASKQSDLEKLNEEKKQTDNEKQKELESKIESSVRDTIVNIASIGTYDADNNLLPVTVKGKSGKIVILRSEAQSLKENWKKTKAKAKKKLRDDLKTYEYFDIIIIHPLTNNEFKLEY